MADPAPSRDQYIADDEFTLYGLDPLKVSSTDIQSVTTKIRSYLHWDILEQERPAERHMLAEGRDTVTLNYRPATELVSVRGRIRKGRRGDIEILRMPEQRYFTPIGEWWPIDIGGCDLFAPTGVLWLPRYIGLRDFNEIEAVYKAGYAEIPDDVKQAVVEVLNAVCAKPTPDTGNVSIDNLAVGFKEATIFTDTARRLLERYRAKKW